MMDRNEAERTAAELLFSEPSYKPLHPDNPFLLGGFFVTYNDLVRDLQSGRRAATGELV